MRLLPSRARAAVAAVLSIALVPLAAPAAAPQEIAPSPEPVLTSAPARIAFAKTAVIKGRLEGGAPGDEVALQRKRSGTDWRTIDIQPVDEDLRVAFRRDRLRRSTTFRLAYRDEVADVENHSDTARVLVGSRLTSRLSRRHTFVGTKVRIKGRLRPAMPGRRVIIHKKVGGEWRFVARVRPDAKGYYTKWFSANNKGRRPIRAVFRGDAHSLRATARRAMKVYRVDLATWYGPGFYGNRTACGRTLTTETLGVAHRTLPCGTKVGILHNGRTITVPVIDRGPYTSANWDLTSKTAQRLGFSGKQNIGVTH